MTKAEVLEQIQTSRAALEAVRLRVAGDARWADLDRRAITIARGAAPFGPFTKAMRREYDQLIFVSRFRFTRNEGLIATVEETEPHDADGSRP